MSIDRCAAAGDSCEAPLEVARTFWPPFHPDRPGVGPFTQPALVRTLTTAESGARALYEGELARRIADGAARFGSPLWPGDIAAHGADRVEPLRARYLPPTRALCCAGGPRVARRLRPHRIRGSRVRSRGAPPLIGVEADALVAVSDPRADGAVLGS